MHATNSCVDGIVEEEFNVPELLTSEQLADQNLDQQSLMTYLNGFRVYASMKAKSSPWKAARYVSRVYHRNVALPSR
jgi:hypothetical protein